MKQRIITAILAIALFAPFVVIGGWPFTAIIYIIASIGLFELLRMRQIRIFSVPGFITWVMLAIILMPSSLYATLFDPIGLTKLELIFAGALLLLVYTVVVKNLYTFDHVAFLVMSALYVGIGFFYLIETRDVGIQFVLYAFTVIWLTDTGAYFVGRKFGKRKLWPEISPNKTIAGFVGGIASAIVAVFIFQAISPITSSVWVLVVVTIIASIIGQLGDLVESAMKRHYDVKDSGTLLPGHGGILDRFDSLLFVLPLLHFLQFVS